jgi:hypothetical protein
MVTIARLRQAMQGWLPFPVCRTVAYFRGAGGWPRYPGCCRWKPRPVRKPGKQKDCAAYASTPVDQFLKKDRLDSTRITHLHCFPINGTFISPQTQQRTGVDYGR